MRPIGSRPVTLALLLLAACGPKPGTTEATDGATSESSTAATDSTGAPTTTAADGLPDDEFGFACIELVRAESEDDDPFVGTARIKATLKYEPCLIEYYTAKHPEQALAGTEGSKTFAEWRGPLCSAQVSDPLVACTVAEFSQTLLDNGPASIYQMTVTYTIPDAAQIEDRTLLWGPGPLESIAECEQGSRPYARVTVQSDLIGLDADGNTLWAALTWANASAVMQRDTAGCIDVDVARVP